MRLIKTALLGLAAAQVASAACNWGATCGNECFNPSHSKCCNDTFSYPHFQLDNARGAAFPLKCCVDPTGAVPAFTDFNCDAIESPVKRTSPLVQPDEDCGMFRGECGNDCFMPQFEFCCGDQVYPQTKKDPNTGGMPKPLYCCTDSNGKEYASFSCDSNPTAVPVPETIPDEDCGMFRGECGNDCFMPQFEFCCGDQVYPQTKKDPTTGGMPKPLYCCTDSTGKEYASFTCDSNPTAVPVPEVRLDDDCGMFRGECGNDCFMPQFEFCCGDQVYPQTKKDPATGGMPKPLFCCTDAQGKEYTAFSCDSTPTAVPVPEVKLDDDCGMFREECGNGCIMPQFEFCCGDQIFPQTKVDPSTGGMPKPLFCCTDANGKEYTDFTCPQAPSVTAPAMPAPFVRLDDDCGMFREECGNGCIMPQFEFCCGDQIFPQTKVDPTVGGMPKPMYCCTDANGKEYAAFKCN